ncbi:MAG TPA: GNAT family N-acetyltransferase [Candidatus Limnocylindrales bacterium]|nr:GNAT family N-acetyltransferase [Candidatus Limnocylindrales bacterium]
MEIDRTSGPARPVRIRAIRPADADALRAFYAELSDESRRTRFFGVTSGIGPGQSRWFCGADHTHREGFVAVPAGPDLRIVGHVCVEPVDESTAEVAVAVDDRWQGHGIGRRLVGAAVEAARRDGYRSLVATMLAGNPAIQRLLGGVDLPVRTRPVGAGVVEASLDLTGLRQAA